MSKDDQYDLDDDAAAWAREKVEHTIAAIHKHARWLEGRGRDDEASGMRRAVSIMERNLIGGDGCVIAAFDRRRADVLHSIRPQQPHDPQAQPTETT